MFVSFLLWRYLSCCKAQLSVWYTASGYKKILLSLSHVSKILVDRHGGLAKCDYKETGDTYLLLLQNPTVSTGRDLSSVYCAVPAQDAAGKEQDRLRWDLRARRNRVKPSGKDKLFSSSRGRSWEQLQLLSMTHRHLLGCKSTSVDVQQPPLSSTTLWRKAGRGQVEHTSGAQDLGVLLW